MLEGNHVMSPDRKQPSTESNPIAPPTQMPSSHSQMAARLMLANQALFPMSDFAPTSPSLRDLLLE